MGQIWSEDNRYRKFLEVELAVCAVQAERGVIPAEAWDAIREKAAFDSKRVAEIESVTHHDVIAFLTSVAEHVGPASRYIHMGMTSSDMLDTATSLQLRESGGLILSILTEFRDILGKRAVEFKDAVCIGRTHGIHAEPTTFGLKLALWTDEIRRHMERLNMAIETISVGKISGAVGTFAHLDPEVEERTCEKLGIQFAPVSTQVIQRDRHAFYLSVLAGIGATLEKIAIEIRHLQKTEVLEAEEYFAKGQKGSSSMPHKRNPIICERIAGLARLLRTNALAGFENVALWHERDISHSSVERVILADSNILAYYMLKKAKTLIEKLLVYPENMINNLNRTNGLIYSQVLLLKLVDKGLSREDAYALVQKPAMECWKTGESYLDVVGRDEAIAEHLSHDEIAQCFDLKVQLRNVDLIFKRLHLIA